MISRGFGRLVATAMTCALATAAVGTTQASAAVLYDADASGSFADEWLSGNAFDVRRGEGTVATDIGFTTTSRITRVSTPAPPAPHTHSWQSTVLTGDADYYSAGAQRSELGMGNPSRVMPDGIDREMRQGDTRFIAYNLYIPRSFDSGSWCSLNQLKGNGASGNGPLGIAIWRGRLDLRKSTSQVTNSTSMTSTYLTPTAVPRDTWLKLVIEVKWSTGTDGYYALHGDIGDGRGFQTLKARTSDWTLKNNITVHPRLGIYREAITGDHSVLYAGFNVSDTRADATTFAFGRSL